MPHQLSFPKLQLVESYLCKYTLFYVRNTFISNAKIKQMRSNSLRPNFCYLKIIHGLIIMKMEMRMKNRSHRYNINKSWSQTQIQIKVNIKCVVLNNTWATSEAQLMKRLSDTEAQLKKERCLQKEACNLYIFSRKMLQALRKLMNLILIYTICHCI